MGKACIGYPPALRGVLFQLFTALQPRALLSILADIPGLFQ